MRSIKASVSSSETSLLQCEMFRATLSLKKVQDFNDVFLTLYLSASDKYRVVVLAELTQKFLDSVIQQKVFKTY